MKPPTNAYAKPHAYEDLEQLDAHAIETVTGGLDSTFSGTADGAAFLGYGMVGPMGVVGYHFVKNYGPTLKKWGPVLKTYATPVVRVLLRR